MSRYFCFETNSKMLQQFKILLLTLIFHLVHSNFEDYDMDLNTSYESCTEPKETGTESNCYCYSQPETDSEYSICAPKKCPVNDPNYHTLHGRCLYFESDIKTFVKSRENCKEKGGKLYEPKDAVEIKEIAKIFGIPVGFVWIGIRIIYNNPYLNSPHLSLNDANYVYDSNNQNINFNPPWLGLSSGISNAGKGGIHKTCIRVNIVNNPNFGKWLDDYCNNGMVPSLCEM